MHKPISHGGLAAALALTLSLAASAKTALSEEQQLLIGAARDLVATVGERVWPGWEGAPFEVLVVTAQREVLLGGARRPSGFEDGPSLPGLGPTLERARVFPEGLLATMPVFGPPPTIVIGTPSATELSPSRWIQVLLHEHFHQHQMRGSDYFAALDRLDLAGGDTSGRWMLEYAFPYDDEALGRSWADLGRRLAALLDPSGGESVSGGAPAFWRRLADFERRLEPADRRYLGFQLWQEGVARFVERRVAEAAATGWSAPGVLADQPGYESFSRLASRGREELLEELRTADLAERRRVSFYAMGDGMARLLERTDPDWKERYERRRFVLTPGSE